MAHKKMDHNISLWEALENMGTYSELMQKDFHYHHSLMYKDLQKMRACLLKMHQFAVKNFEAVPDWLLRFEQEVELVLEIIPLKKTDLNKKV